MSLSNPQKKHYRSIAHQLNPVVTIAGKGLSESVSAELERALEDHELIKIKLAVENRDDRQALIKEINVNHGSTTVQEIGKVAVLFRKAKKPVPGKSNLL